VTAAPRSFCTFYSPEPGCWDVGLAGPWTLLFPVFPDRVLTLVSPDQPGRRAHAASSWWSPPSRCWRHLLVRNCGNRSVASTVNSVNSGWGPDQPVQGAAWWSSIRLLHSTGPPVPRRYRPEEPGWAWNPAPTRLEACPPAQIWCASIAPLEKNTPSLPAKRARMEFSTVGGSAGSMAHSVRAARRIRFRAASSVEPPRRSNHAGIRGVVERAGFRRPGEIVPSKRRTPRSRREEDQPVIMGPGKRKKNSPKARKLLLGTSGG